MTADLLALMVEGHSNEGICGKPFLSPKTVEAHVGHILSELGLRETERPAPPRPRVLSYLHAPHENAR
jgi:DNA-binding NarL/FixJ family response regulator